MIRRLAASWGVSMEAVAVEMVKKPIDRKSDGE